MSHPKGGEAMAGKTEYKNKWQAENCERISLAERFISTIFTAQKHSAAASTPITA